MSETWFISDPHFGHSRIISYEERPFLDSEHMDNHIIEQYNSTVKDGDLVFWLGDMFFCNSARIEYICKRLKLDGKRNILIRGNHDGGISDTKFKRLGFMPYKMYWYDDSLLLTHKPMALHNIEWVRYYFDQYAVNLHGHTHGLDTGLNPRLWQCISMEKTNYQLVSYSQVIKRFTDGRSIDEWSEKTGGKNLYFEEEA